MSFYDLEPIPNFSWRKVRSDCRLRKLVRASFGCHDKYHF